MEENDKSAPQTQNQPGGPALPRGQDEILRRYRACAQDDDPFGFHLEVLQEAMTLSTLREALPESAIDDAWTPVDTEPAARDYLHFAVDKILEHRSLSADRSVIKLREYAWLLGRDDVMSAMDAAAYPQYGTPKVLTFARILGWSYEVDRDEIRQLRRMAAGLPCVDGCICGCGRSGPFLGPPTSHTHV